MATEKVLQAENASLFAEAETLRAAKAIVGARRAALNDQKVDLQKQIAIYNNEIEKLAANINAVEGALQEVNFWETQLKQPVIDDTAVVDQLLRNQE